MTDWREAVRLAFGAEAELYDRVRPDEVLVFAGAEEAIFCLSSVLLGPGDHAVVTWPGYQSLYEVGRAAGAEVTLHELSEADGWPRLGDACAEGGIHLVADEVYRYLELDDTEPLPAGADLFERGISMGVMSKSFALAGLRIGWLATRDRDLLDRCARMKDYTTICSSTPSEILALIGLRARDRVLARSRRIVADNLAILDDLFQRRAGRLSWVRPRGGSIGFPLLLGDEPIDAFAARLVEAEGVLLLPGSQFGHPGNHFRIGFGRENLPAAVERLEAFLDRE